MCDTNSIVKIVTIYVTNIVVIFRLHFVPHKFAILYYVLYYNLCYAVSIRHIIPPLPFYAGARLLAPAFSSAPADTRFEQARCFYNTICTIFCITI